MAGIANNGSKRVMDGLGTKFDCIDSVISSVDAGRASRIKSVA